MVGDKLGRTLRDVRISVTDRCNFRCFFCMPPDKEIEFLQRSELLSYEEIARLVGVLVSLGVRKARITGGEPLMRAHLENLVEKLASIEGLKDIALTTNGYTLDRKLDSLVSAGLKRVTVSLITLNQDKFTSMVGREVSLNRVIEGIKSTRQMGLNPVKVNMVVVRGVNDDEILDIAEFCRENDLHLRFIEFMDVGTLNGWNMDRVVTAQEILSLLDKRFGVEELGERDGSETSVRFRYRDTGQEFGIVASVTRPFCSGCTRLRLSADGKLFTCLFSDRGYDIKKLLRSGASDDDLKEYVKSIWTEREDRYSELRSLERAQVKDRVEMFRVGG